MSGQTHATPPYHQTVGPSYALNKRLGWSQKELARFGGGKKLLPLPGFEPRIVQPVFMLTRATTDNFVCLYLYLHIYHNDMGPTVDPMRFDAVQFGTKPVKTQLQMQQFRSRYTQRSENPELPNTST